MIRWLEKQKGLVWCEMLKQSEGTWSRCLRLTALAFLSFCGPGWCLAVSLTSGCAASLPAKPTTPPPRASCLPGPSPAPKIFVSTRADGCPSPWVACMSAEQAVGSLQHLREVRRWLEAAQRLCGAPNPDHRETTTPSRETLTPAAEPEPQWRREQIND